MAGDRWRAGGTMTRKATLEWFRMRLSPDLAEQGWAPLWSLLYLGFLFLNYNGRPTSTWLPPTVLSVCVFLPLYFRALQVCGRRRLYYGAAIALLGYALIAVNTGANTYLIYAGACASAAGISLRRLIEIIAGALVVFSLELWLLGWPGEYIALSVTITAMVGLAISAANHFHHEKRLRLAELKLSHDEVRRLAALAERERIGRDLHDLLGHTLSLITLKSELAVKLFERDAQAARREIADVERVSRDALGQVRRAVTGIRTAGLSAELASARLLLESSDVRLEYELAEAPRQSPDVDCGGSGHGVPSARSSRASARRTLATARVRTSSACSSASCATRTSVLLATPAANRLPSTRLASAAAAT